MSWGGFMNEPDDLDYRPKKPLEPLPTDKPEQ